MLALLLLIAMFTPPPAVSVTVDLPNAVVSILNSDPAVQEVALMAGDACQPCIVPTPLHELVSVPIVLPAQCGAVELTVTATANGTPLSRYQGSLIHPCPVRLHIPLVYGAAIH